MIFHNLINLTKLYLINSKIEYIESDFFDDLTNLKYDTNGGVEY